MISSFAGIFTIDTSAMRSPVCIAADVYGFASLAGKVNMKIDNSLLPTQKTSPPKLTAPIVNRS